MAALHSALQALSPVEWESVPQDNLKAYLKDIVSQTQLLVDSVPPPTMEESTPMTRPLYNTRASTAFDSSGVYASSARSTPSDPTIASLQKEWGKPYKFSTKENPLGMAVYKLASKDGKGSWFARRSVHEGLGFSKWKKGLEAEFQEGLRVQRNPGEGNVRGIGGEKLVEQKAVERVGKLEVYHLSAQFPGPTAPRDFVTLLISSSAALTPGPHSPVAELVGTNSKIPIPRHFAIISKPCIHPDCPPREGFIRGQYESIEFVREIPLKRSSGSLSPNSPRKGRSRASSTAVGKEPITQNSGRTNTFSVHPEGPSNISEGESPEGVANANETADGRAPARGIPPEESFGEKAKVEQADIHEKDDKHGYEPDSEAETNPVEWIMITRSDPGGSVPRWMVERGTPSSIVADAMKFLDWACLKDHPDSDTEGGDRGDRDELHHEKDSDHAWHINSHLVGLEITGVDERGIPGPFGKEEPTFVSGNRGGMLPGMAGSVGTGISAVTSAIVVNHIPGHHTPPMDGETGKDRVGDVRRAGADTESDSDSSSLASFATAIGYVGSNDAGDEAETTYTSSSVTASSASREEMSNQEKELAKLNERKRRLDEHLAKTRAREEKRANEITAKGTDRLTKVQEKRDREVSKQEEKHKREVQKVEAKIAKEAKKVEERRKKQEEKDQKQKMQLERDEMKAELALLKKEQEILIAQVGELQAENTLLAARLGKLGGGNLVAELKQEAGRAGRLRARSLGSSSGFSRKTIPKSHSNMAEGKENSKEP